MALSFCGSSPTAFMRLKVSRQDIPASTRMLAWELESTVQLPLLPLAKTVMRIATAVQHNGNCCAGGVAKWLTRGNRGTKLEIHAKKSFYPPTSCPHRWSDFSGRHIRSRSTPWADRNDSLRQCGREYR